MNTIVKIFIASIISILVGIAIGVSAHTASTLSYIGGTSEDNYKIFYVVPYEWGFGLYDKNFTKIEKIEVDKGDRVILIILPRPFVPDEIYEELEHEFGEKAIEKGLISSKDEFEKIMEMEEERMGFVSYGVMYVPHGVAIEGYEDSVNVVAKDGLPIIVEFTADKSGSFSIYCGLFCGWGHEYMRIDGGFIVR